MQDHNSLLGKIWKLHSLLNTVWPKPGDSAMAGAAVFLGTDFFNSLQIGISEIMDALRSSEDSEIRGPMIEFWEAFNRVFQHLRGQTKSANSERIDRGLNLLYLSSGILYHRISGFSSEIPEFDRRLIGVEEMDSLFRLCAWHGPTDGELILAAASNEMNSFSEGASE